MTDAAHQQPPNGGPPPPPQQQFDPEAFMRKYIESANGLQKLIAGAETRAKTNPPTDFAAAYKGDIVPLLKEMSEVCGLQQLAAVEYVIVPGLIGQLVPPIVEQTVSQILPDMIADELSNMGDNLTPETAALLREVIVTLLDRSGVMSDNPTLRDDELAAKAQKALEAISEAEADDGGSDDDGDDGDEDGEDGSNG